MNALGPIASFIALVLVIIAVTIFIPAIRERIQAAMQARLAAAVPGGVPAVPGAPQDPLILAERRALVAWERFQVLLETGLFRHVIRFARIVSVIQVVVMVLAMILAVLCDASILPIVLAGVIALVASGVLLWNGFVRTHPTLGPDRAFSPNIFTMVGPTAWCLMGDVFMWLGRPHGDERIDLLGVFLFMGGLMSFELIGVIIIEMLDVGAKAFEGGLNLLIRFARLFLGAFGPEVRDFFVLQDSDVLRNQEWRKDWKEFWKKTWWVSLPFPLIAVLDQGEYLPWAAVFVSVVYWLIWKLQGGAGFDTMPAKKAATIAFTTFAGLLVVRKLLEHAAPELHGKFDTIFLRVVGVAVAGADLTIEWIAVTVQVLATTAVLGVILYCASKLKVVREHAYFQKAVLYGVGGFVVIMFYMLAPSAIARISAPTRAQVFADVPGVLVSWDTSFRGDGVVVQVRDQRGGKFKSVGWVDKRATSWRHFPKAWGNLAYVACFVDDAPQCAEDICRPEEIPPLPAGVLCYEETLMDVPTSSATASN